MNELSVEQQEDIKKRQEEFMQKYQALVEELQVDFAQFPMYIPNGRGAFLTVIHAQLQDKKYLSPVSPFTNNPS